MDAAGARGGAATSAKLIAAAAGFLMFQGELFAGRRLLPEFGGAAYVWYSVILFFQLVLIVGYYGSRGIAETSARTRTVVLALLGLSGLATLLPGLPELPWLPMELQPLVALVPFAGLSIALFTTTPLLHRRQANRSDYRIYAWSNAGALAGLVSYPLLVEPLSDLRLQNWVWALGGLLVATVGLAGPSVAGDAEKAAAKKGGTRWQWWVLPAISSALLLAATNRLSYEASIGPLTWALPLAVFLVAYVWAFGAKSRVSPAIVAFIGLLALEAAYVILADTWLLLLDLLLASGAAMLACNSILASTRNENTHGFYRATAIGGAIGSIIMVMVVPRVTTWPIEFPLLTIGTLALAGMWRGSRPAKLAVAVAAIAVATCSVCNTMDAHQNTIARARTPYGSLSVVDMGAGLYSFYNNGTLHGEQSFDAPEEALTYYQTDSGLAIVIAEKQRENATLSIGAVGLGTGTISWYLRPQDSITYYEIDAKVEEMARQYFTYLQKGRTEVVIGDARRSLEEENRQFDILVLDAFSGDAIPTHLLTREAGEIYRRRLKSGGVVAVHVSNRYADLKPVAAGLARSMGMSPQVYPTSSSTWTVLKPGTFGAEQSAVQWTDERSSVVPLLRSRQSGRTKETSPAEPADAPVAPAGAGG